VLKICVVQKRRCFSASPIATHAKMCVWFGSPVQGGRLWDAKYCTVVNLFMGLSMIVGENLNIKNLDLGLTCHGERAASLLLTHMIDLAVGSVFM
jgi:hypothetical protein